MDSVSEESKFILKLFARKKKKEKKKLVFTNACVKSKKLKPTSNTNIDCNVIAKTIKKKVLCYAKSKGNFAGGLISSLYNYAFIYLNTNQIIHIIICATEGLLSQCFIKTNNRKQQVPLSLINLTVKDNRKETLIPDYIQIGSNINTNSFPIVILQIK